MAQFVDVIGFGEIEFPDNMSPDDMSSFIRKSVLPNHDPKNPDPAAVRARPDLFPNIDRGSFFGGAGSGLERLGRAPEAVGAGVFRSQEELDSLRTQMEEEAHDQRYRATLEDVGNYWEQGNWAEAASTLLGDVLPQTLGESLPDMGIIGAGAWAGATAGALAGTAGGPLAPITAPVGATVGAIGGAAIAGLPTFFGMNVERQIQENDITDPEQIEALNATSAALLQGALEGTVLRVLNLIPGLKGLGANAIVGAVKRGATSLTTRQGLMSASNHAIAGGATEAVTEVGQQMLERAQAGLEVFNPEALDEYVEAAILGGMLGVTLGSATGTYGLFRNPGKLKAEWARTDAILADYEADLKAIFAGRAQQVTDPKTGRTFVVPTDPPLPALPAPQRTGPALSAEDAHAEVALEQARADRLEASQDADAFDNSRFDSDLAAWEGEANKTSDQRSTKDYLDRARESQVPLVFTAEELKKHSKKLAGHRSSRWPWLLQR